MLSRAAATRRFRVPTLPLCLNNYGRVCIAFFLKISCRATLIIICRARTDIGLESDLYDVVRLKTR